MSQERNEIQNTWKKIESQSIKAGLRNGLSDGRESNFQQSFDTGFSEGFYNGFQIGKYKGVLSFKSKQGEVKDEEILENPERAWCNICTNKELLETNTIPEIVCGQKNVSNKFLQQLSNTYDK